MDAGAIAAQEWVFVKKGETARELWERALAPLGQRLLAEVIDYAKAHKSAAGQAAGRAVRDQGAQPPTVSTNLLPGPIPESPKARDRGTDSRSQPGTGFTLMCLIHRNIFGFCGAANFEHIVPG